MTRRRMITLVSGVVILALASFYKLSQDSGPPKPPRPSELSSAEIAAIEDSARITTLEGRTMGTSYTVKFIAPHLGVAEMAPVVIEAALTEVVAAMSTYDSKSEVSIFNKLPAKTSFKPSADFLEVLRVSAEVSEKTGGAFDITVRPLVSAYGFGALASDTPPNPEQLQEIRARVGMSKLTLDIEEGTLLKLVPGVELDLGGVAKGYGVDQVARALEKIGVESYMVEVGGEIRVRGRKAEERPWKLALEEPRADGRSLHATLSLPQTGAALATSGDYRNFRKLAGKVVSHTFDARSGEPVSRRTASVSVVRPTATEADALATALGVLTPEQAILLANQEKWAVYLLVHQEGGGFTPKMSETFKEVSFSRASQD